MAKVVRKQGAEINGVNRLFVGDRIAFVNEICKNDTFVSSLENDEGEGESDKTVAVGVTAINVDTFQPVNIQYTTLWGTACTQIDVDGIKTRTPQGLHDAGRHILCGGSNAIENGRVYKVGGVYSCEFYSKRKNDTYPWDVVGLCFTDESVKIEKTKISFNGKSETIETLKKRTAEIDEIQSKKSKGYIIK